jgi:hypothetical protein
MARGCLKKCVVTDQSYERHQQLDVWPIILMTRGAWLNGNLTARGQLTVIEVSVLCRTTCGPRRFAARLGQVTGGQICRRAAALRDDLCDASLSGVVRGASPWPRTPADLGASGRF